MNTANSPTQESFLRDVSEHQMIASHDDGAHHQFQP